MQRMIYSAALTGHFFKRTPQEATTVSTSTSSVLTSDSASAWTDQFLVFVAETAQLYAFAAPIASADATPVDHIAVMRCTRMRDDSGGGLLLAVHGTNSCKWVLRAHGDTAAMGWMDAVNRICGGLYGGGGIVSRSASLEVQNDVIAHNVTMQHSKSHNAPFTPASSTGPQLVRANSISNGRNYNGVATANGAMAAAKREARMRKEHQEYILKQQQLCEQRKLEVAMRKEMEIFERGKWSGDGLASGKSHGQTGSDEDLLRLEASKLLQFLS
ncbi:hypothetical protein HDU84_003923 [Entophlyctis sp. JEL0112]|nr:hypothetical protein HDU84_003923 [Entophlyctis sp. JEL0112]